MSAPEISLFPEFPIEDERHHHETLMAAVGRVMGGGKYILAEEVRSFEEEFAAFLGGGHVAGVASGTDAIELVLRALGIGAGAGVVLPAMAPSAVAAAVRRAGARIVLSDVENRTLTLCPAALEKVLAADCGIRAVLAVHLYGHPCDWQGLKERCEVHGVRLIEDVSQAHGALWRQRKTGSLGEFSVWSFYPTKNLGALGDAGAVWARDSALIDKIRCLREYGWESRHVSNREGINSRMDEIQAAMLRVKLRTLLGHVQRRRMLADVYLRCLSRVRPLEIREDSEHAFNQFVVRTPERASLQQHLARLGMPTLVLYPAALHQQPAFACVGRFPVAEQAAREVLSLPLHPYLDSGAVGAVCAAVERWAA